MVQGKKVIAFVPASGTGSRMGLKVPKQFVTINDIPICFYPLKLIQDNPRIDEIVIGVPEGWNEYVNSMAKHLGISKLKYIVNGGQELPQTMRNMLSEVNNNYSDYIIMMFDGDRMIFDDIIDRSLDNFIDNGITISYFNPYEAGFYMDGKDLSDSFIDRKKVFLIAPPFIYPSNIVNSAMQYAIDNNLRDMYLHELAVRLGYEVSFIKCSMTKLKITEPSDIEVAKSMINECIHNW